MDWRNYIHSDPAVLAGKPVVRGTRIAVDLILEKLGAGETPEQILSAHPRLTSEARPRSSLLPRRSVPI
jgi:uncharacterized protein (DUF433 family)